jgi:hypothetical protein
MKTGNGVAYIFGALLALTANLSSPSLARAHQQLPSACDRSNPATCLYISDLAYDVGEISRVRLTDTTRNNYDLWLVIPAIP